MHETTFNKSIKIVIIDKHKLFREGIRRVLELDSVIDVVAEGESIKDALQLAKKNQPDIMLVDIKVIAMEGITEIKNIIKHTSNTKVIILSERDDDNYMIETMKMGATGYVLKEMNPDTFISAIKEVNNGKYWFHPHVTHYIIRDYYHLIQETFGKSIIEDSKTKQPLDIFTSREYDVLLLLAKGYSNKVIAEKLNITRYTVSSHVRNILKKSKANDRTHAVVKAIENGWVTIARK